MLIVIKQSTNTQIRRKVGSLLQADPIFFIFITHPPLFNKPSLSSKLSQTTLYLLSLSLAGLRRHVRRKQFSGSICDDPSPEIRPGFHTFRYGHPFLTFILSSELCSFCFSPPKADPNNHPIWIRIAFLCFNPDPNVLCNTNGVLLLLLVLFKPNTFACFVIFVLISRFSLNFR